MMTRSFFLILSRSDINGLPILPPIQAVRGETNPAVAMRPNRVVVVVFPADPVIPITGQGTFCIKIWESFDKGI